MKLTIDIGNTCAKLVAFDNDSVVEEVRMDEDEWGKLTDFCRKYSFNSGIWSSVVELSEAGIRHIEELPFPMMKLESGVTPVPIINKYATPHTLGTDRLAAVVGAYVKGGGANVLVVDVGTCITYDFITASGEYLGGNISPGPTMRFKALAAYTSKLPLVERKGEQPVIGFSTETAIRSGVMTGVEYEINGYIRDFSLKYPDLKVYLTGGIHLNLHNSEKITTFADDFIVPYGLNRILQYNEDIKTKE